MGGIGVLVLASFYADGPQFLDYRDSVFRGVGLLVVNASSGLVSSALRLPVFRDLVAKRAQNQEMARRLRKLTRWVTVAGGPMLIFGIAYSTWLNYYQIEHLSRHIFWLDRLVLIFIGILSFVAFVLCIPQTTGVLTCFFVMQMVTFMDFAACFNELDEQIASIGIEQSLKQGVILKLHDVRIVRFQRAFLETSKAQQVINRRLAWMFVMVWSLSILLFFMQGYYSLYYLLIVPTSALDGELENWQLSGRALAPFATDLLLLIPFMCSRLFREVRNWAARLILVKPGSLHSLTLFVSYLDLDFPLGPLKANPIVLGYTAAFLLLCIFLRGVEVYAKAACFF